MCDSICFLSFPSKTKKQNNKKKHGKLRQVGACKRGSACNFAHDSVELKEMLGSPRCFVGNLTWAYVGCLDRPRWGKKSRWEKKVAKCAR